MERFKEALAATLANPLAIGVILLVVCIAVLILALLVSQRRERELAERVGDMDDALQNISYNLSGNGAADGDEPSAHGEELAENLRSLSESVSRAMGDITRAQQGQLDIMSEKLAELRSRDETREQAVRQSFETRLQSYESRIDRIGDALDDKLDKNERRMESMRESVERQMLAIRDESGRKLDEMRLSVDERISSSLDHRLDESFQLVSERLERVYSELGEMQSLASGVGDLKRVLTDVRARGALGDIQLAALLAQILSEDQYLREPLIKEGCPRPDFAIRMPASEGDSLLPVDANYPAQAYQKLVDALGDGDPALIDACGHRFEDAMLERASEMRRDFLHPPRTANYAVLFLPVEGLYAEVLRRTGLMERLQGEFQIIVTGPATLTALLNSIQMGFRSLALEKRSGEVWELLGAVRGEFANFAQSLARTQKRIRQASESIEDAARRSRVLEKQLKGVRKIGEAPAASETEEDDWE